ncbi:MAG: TetR/AcrR family transcriptional regulator C-terminal domain-containing protein [Gaiellaceae bacterium]
MSKKRPLNRERVLDAAIVLADRGGIDALTMRKLAHALGVEAMSLYNHVADKEDMVDAIVDRIIGEIELPEGGDWETAIRACAVSAHASFVRHPWACNLAMSPGRIPATPSARMRYMEWLLARLREGGFSPELAYHAYHALDSHILGFTLWELGHSTPAGMDVGDAAASVVRALPADEFPYLLEHIHQHLDGPEDDGVTEFEFGLDLILDGIKRAGHAASAGRL